VPIKQWYDVIGEKIVVDATLDSIVHGAQRIKLKVNHLEESGAEKNTRETIKLLFLLIKKHPSCYLY
jgi:hypothetical protein